MWSLLVGVAESCVVNYSTLTSSLLQLLSPRQPLKPRRKPCHKPKPQNTHVEQCSLSIRIVRAINVPVRDTPTGVGGAGGAGQTEVRSIDSIVWNDIACGVCVLGVSEALCGGELWGAITED